MEGGAVVPLGEIINFAGASGGEDGSIFVSEPLGRGLIGIPAGGGQPETVAGLDNGEGALARPQILPGGKAILFAAVTAYDIDNATIDVLTLADRHRKAVARGGQYPRYLPSSSGATSGVSGHLIYVNKATMFAIPFDLDRLETRGTAVPVLYDVAYDSLTGTSQFDISGTGTLVYRRASGAGSPMRTMQWLDPTGKKEPIQAKPGAYGDLRLSPDGKRIALTVGEGASRDVWFYDPQRDAMTRLTFGGGNFRYPTWTPDGQFVVVSSYGNGIVQARADGASQPQTLTQSGPIQIPWSFTPDGKRLAYFEFKGPGQIWTVPLEE